MKKNNSAPEIILSPYMESVHRAGRVWCLLMVAVLIAVPLIDCVLLGTMPDMKGLGMGLLATAPMYYAVCIVEVFTYVPMLGAGGSYLSFVTGNISNLKLPCAINAMEQAGVKANSEEGEVISTIAIAGGLGAAFLARNLKISLLPLIVMTVLFIAVPALNAGTVGIVVPVSVLFTVLEAWFMYKKGWV